MRDTPPGEPLSECMGDLLQGSVPLLLLAGHVDTVPVAGAVLPSTRHGDVNLGLGDPRYAHTDEEQAELPALVECYDIIRAFLRAPGEG